MGEREIKAKEVVKDIRAGMGHVALMEKYKLTPLGLHNLFEELTNLGLLEPSDDSQVIRGRKRIRVKEVVSDIKAGLSDPQLMAKYSVSRSALQTLFKKLLDLRAVDSDTLFGQMNPDQDAAIPPHIRELERYSLDFEIPVYEAGAPETQARIHDITEKGLGLRGITFRRGQTVDLVILGDAFGVVSPFELRAICRWAGLDENDEQAASGFEILEITEESMSELRKLIKLTTFAQ